MTDKVMDKVTDNNAIDYSSIVEYRNVYNRYARHMGVKTLEIRDGYARSEMEIIPDYTNAIGSVHGACLFSIADCCTGSAASSTGMMMTTLNCNMNYYKPGINVKKLTAEAECVKSGKTICVYEVKIWDDTGTLLATGTFTYYNLHKPLLTDRQEDC